MGIPFPTDPMGTCNIELPDGYTALQSLRTEDTAIIDTGVPFAPALRVEYGGDEVQGAWAHYTHLHADSIWVGSVPQNLHYYTGTYRRYIDDITGKHSIVVSQETGLVVDGERKANVSFGPTKGYAIVFFGMRDENDNSYRTRNLLRSLSYFRISRNGVALRDYVPALDADGTPCMFDLVTKQAYYNVNTTGHFEYDL